MITEQRIAEIRAEANIGSNPWALQQTLRDLLAAYDAAIAEEAKVRHCVELCYGVQQRLTERVEAAEALNAQLRKERDAAQNEHVEMMERCLAAEAEVERFKAAGIALVIRVDDLETQLEMVDPNNKVLND